MDDGTILIWIDGRWFLAWTMGPFLCGLMVDGLTYG
jgi:hypothetical protein